MWCAVYGMVCVVCCGVVCVAWCVSSGVMWCGVGCMLWYVWYGVCAVVYSVCGVLWCMVVCDPTYNTLWLSIKLKAYGIEIASEHALAT